MSESNNDDDYEDDFGSEGENSSQDDGDDEDASTGTSRAPVAGDGDDQNNDAAEADDLQWPLVDPAAPASQTKEDETNNKGSPPLPAPAPAPAPASPAPSRASTTLTASSPAAPSTQQKLIDTSVKLVKSEEKNLALGLRLERANEELARVKADVSECSKALLSGLGVSNATDKYQNVPLAELLRLRLQECSCSCFCSSASSILPSSAEKRPLCNTSNTSNSHRQQDDVTNIHKLERRLATEKQRSKILEGRVAELQSQLDGANVDADNEADLKLKVSRLADRARTERELRGRAEKDLAKSKEQTEVLAEHIETLVMQLKQQASAKSQALKDLSSASREVDLLRSRSAAMSKRNARKDSLINDLRNEATALESELQKMQEKYGELRLKVDWTRSQTTNTLKKKSEEIEHLQTKLEFLARKDRVLEGMNSSYEQKSKVINTHTGRKTVSVRRGVSFR